MDFDFSADPATAPVWVGFPGLPVNLYHEDCMRSIAGNFGPVLRIHDRTLAMTDTAEALACVELNLSTLRRERLWIDMNGFGFWQMVKYYKVPDLCRCCHKIGHSAGDCKSKMMKPKAPPARSNGDTIGKLQTYVPRHLSTTSV